MLTCYGGRSTRRDSSSTPSDAFSDTRQIPLQGRISQRRSRPLVVNVYMVSTIEDRGHHMGRNKIKALATADH